MKLFLDSSVIIAASLSATGASRIVFDLAAAQGWPLIVSPWVLREVRENLAAKPPAAARAWVTLGAKVVTEEDELTFEWPLVFDVAKDKPVLCTCARMCRCAAHSRSPRLSIPAGTVRI